MTYDLLAKLHRSNLAPNVASTVAVVVVVDRESVETLAIDWA